VPVPTGPADLTALRLNPRRRQLVFEGGIWLTDLYCKCIPSLFFCLSLRVRWQKLTLVRPLRLSLRALVGCLLPVSVCVFRWTICLLAHYMLTCTPTAGLPAAIDADAECVTDGALAVTDAVGLITYAQRAHRVDGKGNGNNSTTTAPASQRRTTVAATAIATTSEGWSTIYVDCGRSKQQLYTYTTLGSQPTNGRVTRQEGPLTCELPQLRPPPPQMRPLLRAGQERHHNHHCSAAWFVLPAA
jgi:hypothetical protein